MQDVLLFSRYLQLCERHQKVRVQVSNEWTVAAWSISGNDSQTRRFQQRLQTSSLHRGEKSQIKRMTLSLVNGVACALNSDPFSSDISATVNFLASLFEDGYQYRSINNYRSAISSAHDKINGYDVGQHPLVIRLLKGVFHQRPSQPRYSTTWDVSNVLSFVITLGDNSTLTLSDLTHKTVMLLALTRPSRSVDLANLDTRLQQFSPEGATFQSCVPAKQSRQSKPLAEFFFATFTDDVKLCPVKALMENVQRTEPHRSGETRLFLATIRPHKPVTSSTIARLLKAGLSQAGIDTTIFKAHSTRSTSASATADWSSQSVFQKFYYKPQHNASYSNAVLSCKRRCQPLGYKLRNHVDMEAEHSEI